MEAVSLIVGLAQSDAVVGRRATLQAPRHPEHSGWSTEHRGEMGWGLALEDRCGMGGERNNDVGLEAYLESHH